MSRYNLIDEKYQQMACRSVPTTILYQIWLVFSSVWMLLRVSIPLSQRMWYSHGDLFECTYHTVAIWTFPFHQNPVKKSDDFPDLTLAQYNLKKWYFWLMNEGKNVLSNPVLFAHCACYSTKLKYQSFS